MLSGWCTCVQPVKDSSQGAAVDAYFLLVECYEYVAVNKSPENAPGRRTNFTADFSHNNGEVGCNNNTRALSRRKALD